MKEGNVGQKISRCPNIRDNNFNVLRSAIALNKVDLECAENVRAKPTGNNLSFITYSNTIDFSGIWLDNSDYIVNKLQNIVK